MTAGEDKLAEPLPPTGPYGTTASSGWPRISRVDYVSWVPSIPPITSSRNAMRTGPDLRFKGIAGEVTVWEVG